MMRGLAILLPALYVGAALAETSPMERLLKEQIADQRMKERMPVPKPKPVIKKPVATKTPIARPPYKIQMIAGNGKNLYAFLMLPDGQIIRVSKESQLHFSDHIFKVAQISADGVVLISGKRQWRLPFISASSAK